MIPDIAASTEETALHSLELQELTKALKMLDDHEYSLIYTGQLPKYWTQNHHEAIVSREIFDAVQEETARWKAMASGTKKSAPTGLGKYSSKHALTGLLICGECGRHTAVLSGHGRE